MGTVASAVSGRVDVFKMNAFDEIDFQDHLRKEFEMARAAGRQEQLTQAVRSGGFGGSNIGLGGGSFNNPATFWFQLGSVLGGRFIAPAMFILFAIMFLSFYIGTPREERNQTMIFISSFLSIFGLMNLFIFNTETGLKSMTTPQPLLGSIGVSAVAAGVITFVA